MNDTFDYTQYGSDTLSEEQRCHLQELMDEAYDKRAVARMLNDEDPWPSEREKAYERELETLCTALRHIDRQQAENKDLEEAYEYSATKCIESEEREKALEVENAALKAEVERLAGLVPKCCDCGKAIAADELAVCSNCMYSGS